jgi:hypothetical protein
VPVCCPRRRPPTAVAQAAPAAADQTSPPRSPDGCCRLRGPATPAPPAAPQAKGSGRRYRKSCYRWRKQALLPTPRASDGAKGCPGQPGSRGDLTLPSAAVQLLPTPTAARYGRNKSPSPGAAQRPGLDCIGELIPSPPAGAGQHATPDPGESVPWGRYQEAISRWEAVLGRPAPAPTQPGSTGTPVLAPALVEWLMGLPEQWVTDPQLGLARTAALRVLGNGVVPQQAAIALRILLCPQLWASP